MIFHISYLFSVNEMFLVLNGSASCFIYFELIQSNVYLKLLLRLMITNIPSYKLTREVSVDDSLYDLENPYHQDQHVPQKRFFTQKKINVTSRNHDGNHNDHFNRIKYLTGDKNDKQISLSGLNQNQMLEYSNTQQPNDGMTLAGLGIRRGHSFQKQKLQFSLSSEVVNTQHENQLLKKKMIEMKKQVQFLRKNDQELQNQISQYRQRIQVQQRQITFLQQKLKKQKQHMCRLQEQVERKQSQVEELQRLLQKSPRKVSEKQMSQVIQQLEEFKKIAQTYQCQIEKLKQQYEKQLRLKVQQYQKQIQFINFEFWNAKNIGQKQIQQLITTINEKDNEIMALQSIQKSPHASQKKKSTQISDNPSIFKSTNYKSPPKINNHYINRFFQFSKLLDQKIYHSCQKQKAQSFVRFSKSEINKKSFDCSEIQITPGINYFQKQSKKLSQLLDKNDKFKKLGQQFKRNNEFSVGP